jgi:hypothetical protein
VAFTALVTRFDSIVLDGAPVWRPGFTFRGLETLPIVLMPPDVSREIDL